MGKLIEKLSQFFKGAKKVAIVGVGSDMRGDDAAGVEVVRRLKRVLTSRRVMLIEGGVAPENFTSKIVRFKPSHVVFIDAADIGVEPGGVNLIEPEKIIGSAFTHRLPLSILSDYLRAKTGAKVLLVGIQPENVTFCNKISKRVDSAICKVTLAIEESLSAILGSPNFTVLKG